MMTDDAKLWRKNAAQFRCTLCYSSHRGSSSRKWGYAPDEAKFHALRRDKPNWFVLNDARATTAKYKLVLHHCDCRHLRNATTHNWPKVVAQRRESLEQWAKKFRTKNPILTCSVCIG